MKFENKDLYELPTVKEKNYDLNAVYDRAHSELTLQQNKRDQIISLYLALVSFIIPFSFSIESLNMGAKGFIFLGLGIVGIMFAGIIVRYRVYKEAYWLCCQTVSQLMNYRSEDITKKVVQATYYRAMVKRSASFVKANKNGKLNYRIFVRKNLYSAETLHYLIHLLVVAVIFGLGAAVTFDITENYRIAAGCVSGIALMAILLCDYFKKLAQVYAVVIDGEDRSFNSTFSKAWFLHFYEDV